MATQKIIIEHDQEFIHHLPYWSILDDVIVNVDGAISKGLKLEGIDIWTQPLHAVQERLACLYQLLHGISAGSSLQFIYDVNRSPSGIIEEYESGIVRSNDVSTALKNDRLEFLRSQKDIRNIDIYVFVTKQHQSVKQKFFGAIRTERCVAITQQQHDKAISDLRSVCDLIVSHLKGKLNMSCTSLSGQEYVDLIFRYLNPKKSGFLTPPQLQREGTAVSEETIPHPFEFKDHLTAREQLGHSACEVKKNHLVLDDRFVRTLTLKVPFDQTYAGIVDNIVNGLKFPYRMVVNVTLLDNSDYIAKIELERRRKRSFQLVQKDRNVGNEVALSEIDKALLDQMTQQFQFVNLSLAFVIQAVTLEELEEYSQELMTHVRNVENACLLKEEYTQLKYFLTTLPGNGYRNDRLHTATSFNAGDLMPLYKPLIGTKACDAVFHTDRKTLFKFSPFSPELRSYNQIIIGSTGSGKSFASNYLLNMQLIKDFDSEVMILDLGDSFRKTALIWGGQYLTIDLNDPHLALNPFCPPSAIVGEDGVFNNDIVNFIAKLLSLMIRGDDNDILQVNVLEEAVRALYRRITDREPLLGDYLDILNDYGSYCKDKDDIATAKQLARQFNLFANGSYARMFNRPSTVDFSARFICVDIQGATNNTHLKEIVTTIVGMHMLRRLMRNRNPKRIILEEFASVLSHPAGYKLCELMARNGRKFGGSITAISQGAKDFVSCPAAATLLENSNIKWILKTDEHANFFQDRLELTERDMHLIRELRMMKGEYSQIFLKYQDQKVVLNLYSSPLLYWCCTTNPQDLRLQDVYERHFHGQSLLEVMQILARTYPQGAVEETMQNDPIIQGDEHAPILATS